MNVNGVSSSVNAYAAYSAGAGKTEVAAEKTADVKTTVREGVVYEPSTDAEQTSKTVSKQDRSAIVQQIKEANQARVNQMTQLVHDMLAKQGNAYGQANDIWKFLASGNFTVDAQTKAQAQADIAEDGYWGVSQTSSRIYDFAMALAGDDEDKMKEMQAAFEKGFAMAKKKWGGELPDISQKTYDAVNKKFEEYFNSKKEIVTE